MTTNDRAAPTTPAPAFAEKDAPAKRHTLRPTPTALCGGFILLFWIIVALIGPVIAPFGEGDIGIGMAVTDFVAPLEGFIDRR